MSSWLIAFVGLIYLGVAVDSFIRGDTPMGIVFAGYAFSNVGLYILARATCLYTS
jgi:hypothetical protein